MTTATATATASLATHNGTLTVKSERTGEHRTFEIRSWTPEKDQPPKRIVSLLEGPDNTASYRGFGFIFADETKPAGFRIVVWKKKRGGQHDALARMLENLPALEVAGKVEVFFATTCRRCNRKLTTPESVLSGIGPICAGKE